MTYTNILGPSSFLESSLTLGIDVLGTLRFFVALVVFVFVILWHQHFLAALPFRYSRELELRRGSTLRSLPEGIDLDVCEALPFVRLILGGLCFGTCFFVFKSSLHRSALIIFTSSCGSWCWCLEFLCNGCVRPRV
ncbi:hypothetical protein C2G38_2220388 [Gigaspora rosea]|uniref:Transmembrane protein n=1 Tax=Gigaspora rosea TaxID=44941 RepID=A0A397UCV4_9GLOM|nr:hypothetical protein C2G38_2220388 [Gigaspora rosea]